ncbi:YVTN family beta-propeller repeat protein [Edaphobacter albus]|uniref:YVTN family beta-propeller repeat protein n=1 Tax=Edaphobacter sp. 4G125 TaxID=2763071 RepID=UPI001644C55F|nr:cytochrome D1 domain-containing protein [Edaphobacter sp. 4G125]QNI36621.1 beta-propeller fold lactonase family protein [Edaphobacter sp. 4G125]
MKKEIFWSVMVCGALCASSLAARSESLLVANQHDQSLSVIDTATNKVVATIPVGGVTGHEVAVSPDGKTAYVPIYGNAGVGRAGTDGAQISVIDLATRKIVGKVEFDHGVRPHCAVYDRHTGMLLVTTELDKSVTIIDPKTLKIVGSIPTGQEQSHMFALSADGRRGYTANVGPGTVSVLDVVGRKTLAVIPISGNTQRIAISRDGSMVFTADQKKPQLAVIDTATNKVKTWVALPAVGYGTAPTRDGRWLLVTMRGAKQVAVVDLKTLKVDRTLDVADGPSEVVVTPDGKRAYVACNFSNQISVVDLNGGVGQWKVVQTIDAGKYADGMALTR